LNVKHHSQAADLRARFKVPELGVSYHTVSLRKHPARLKLVLSDTATLPASAEFNLTVPSFIQIAAKGFFEPTLPDFCIAANYCYEARGRKRTLSERDLSTDMGGRMTN
jgi:hypothetical protein